MSDKIFLDTNVFIYAIDASPQEKKKREIGREIVIEHIRNVSGVISIQVLQEFYQTSTQKIRVPLSTEEALEFLQYISILETVHPDFNMLVTSIRLHQKYKISFWDSLILQAAMTSGCSHVLSEDLQDGFQIDHLTVKNPFK